jgi:hypothetical protein
MSFLFPLTLFLGLLAPVIAALYLRRPKRRQMEVSSLLFWRKILEQQPHRRFLGRLRNPFSLLLQLLIFLLLLLALAHPEWGRVQGGQSTVVVLDARARMQAGDGEVFRAAINAARDVVSQAGPGNEVALLTAEGTSQILSPFSADGRDLRERLATLTPSDAGGEITDTLALARNLLKGRTGATKAVIITDRPLPDADGFEQILVGKPRDNTAILALAQRPLPASPQSAEIFARLGNFSATDRDLELELTLDGRAFDLKKFHLPAGAEQNFSTIVPEEMLRSSQGLLAARLIGKDDLSVDDMARSALPTGRKLRVLLISENNPFLEGAIKADPGIDLEILTPSAWRANLAENFDAVVFDNWTPPGAKPEDFSQGGYFFFGRSPFDADGEDIAIADVGQTTSSSPLLWNVDSSALRFGKARKLQPPDDWRVTTPLESVGQPLLMSLERPGPARIVVAAFSVDSSTFPLRVGFPLFVSNTLHWLADRDLAEGNEFLAGQTFLPAEGEKIARLPQQENADPGSHPASTTDPLRLRKNGFYEVQGSKKTGPRWIAVNTASREEADLRTATANRNLLLLRHGGLGLQPWQWLALAALVLILGEWFLHHRRITE